MQTTMVGNVLTVSAGAFSEDDMLTLVREHPSIEFLDLRPARMEVAPAAMAHLKTLGQLRGVAFHGWDNFTGGVGDKALRDLSECPALTHIHARYCMASIGTPEIFGLFPKLERVWADYWCVDESDMLDDLRSRYPKITFVGADSNHGELDDPEPKFGIA